MGWISITTITFGIACILSSCIAYLCAKTGMNGYLLSRGGCFGYIGASLTSLIYASNFIMYCAFEGMILVYAVHEFCPSIPMWIYIIIFGSLVIPLNWFGIKQLDKLQKWSMPLFIVFLGAAIVVSLFKTP